MVNLKRVAMKKSKNLAYMILVIVFASSCSQVTFNKINTTVYETRQQDINKGAIPYNPVIADLRVDLDKKISGSSIRQVTRYNDFELENTKQAALYNAVTNSSADVVIDPVFKINITNNDGRDDKVTIQAEVSGFFGKYTDIHKAETKELENAMYGGSVLYSKASNITNSKNITPLIPDPDQAATAAATEAHNKKKRRKIIGWTVGTTLILSLGLGLGLGLSGNGFGGL